MRTLRFEYEGELSGVKHLIEYTCDARSWKWSYDGEIAISYHDRRFEGWGRGDWTTPMMQLDLPRFSSSLLHNNQSYGVMIEKGDCPVLSAADGSWISDDLLVRDSRCHDDDSRERVDVELFNVSVGDPEAATPAHGLVIGGGGLRGYTHPMPHDRAGEGGSIDGIVTTLFGRPAVLRDIPTDQSVKDLLVVYEGRPLTDEEQVALWLVTTFLAGNSGAVIASMAVRGSDEVGRRAYAWSRPSVSPRPPIALYPCQNPEFSKQIANMCETARSLLTEGRDGSGICIDVALMHLFADHRGFLDLEMRDLTLALDALVESNATSQDKATAIPAAEYKKLRPELEKAVSGVLADTGYAGGDLERRLLERLRGGNDMSVTRRREAFWSRTGMLLKADEIEALSNRHIMAHAGILLRRAGDEKMQKLAFQVQMIRTLANRAILALFGYRGHVLDYSTGRNMRWEHFERRLPSVFGEFGV